MSGSCCWYEKKKTHICSVKTKLTIISVSHGLYSTLVKNFSNINTHMHTITKSGRRGRFITTHMSPINKFPKLNKTNNQFRVNELSVGSASWISFSFLFSFVCHSLCGLWVCRRCEGWDGNCWGVAGRALENRCCRRFYDFSVSPIRFFLFFFCFDQQSPSPFFLLLFSGSFASFPHTAPHQTHTLTDTLAFRVAHAGSFDF